jgi:hypothetical protein
MRRAILLIASLCLASALGSGISRAQSGGGFQINGVGLIDYGRKPDFKVGSWTRYHVTGGSSLGNFDDYVVTVGVAGEEKFWGEDCFWVETATTPKGGGPTLVATLMSYQVFNDSLPFPHMQFYMRKTISESDARGNPLEMVNRRPPGALKTRDRKERNLKWYIDTLGVETVPSKKGEFACKHVHIRQDVQIEVDKGDSTISEETKEDRESFVSPKVPLTGIVREDIEFKLLRQAWLIGRSKDAPTLLMTHSSGRAELEDFGDDYHSELVPAAKQHSIREQERAAAAAAAQAPKPATKSTPKTTPKTK